MRLSDGSVHAARLRGPGHDVLHQPGDVRRVPREALRVTAVAAQDGAGRPLRQKERRGLLRLLRREAGGIRSDEMMENVKTEIRDGILFVTVDRPKVLNALNARTVEEIGSAFEGA